MEKILVSKNLDAVGKFQREVEYVRDKANELIGVFHAFQPWEKITSLPDFIKLCSDPKKTFDETLIANVEIKAVGLRPDPARLADLFNISRDEFMNLVAGMPVNETECKPCQKARIRKGEKSIDLVDFEKYQEFLIFKDGAFELDNEAVKVKTESFAIYAETPQQIEVVEHWQRFCEILNKHREKGFCRDEQITQEFAQKAGLSFSEATFKFHVPEQTLVSEIFKLNK
jgi:hypothetical protein